MAAFHKPVWALQPWRGRFPSLVGQEPVPLRWTMQRAPGTITVPSLPNAHGWWLFNASLEIRGRIQDTLTNEAWQTPPVYKREFRPVYPAAKKLTLLTRPCVCPLWAAPHLGCHVGRQSHAACRTVQSRHQLGHT